MGATKVWIGGRKGGKWNVYKPWRKELPNQNLRVHYLSEVRKSPICKSTNKFEERYGGWTDLPVGDKARNMENHKTKTTKKAALKLFYRGKGYRGEENETVNSMN